MSYYTPEWLQSISKILNDTGVELPERSSMHSGTTKGELANRVIRGRFTFDFALPQGIVDQYYKENDYDIRGQFVTAYPEGHGLGFGIVFPLTIEAMMELNEIHCNDEESQVEL